MKKRFSRIQIVRVLVQAMVLGIMTFAGFNTKHISDWLFPTVLLVGVFFCGWVCPLGAAQDWVAALGRWLRLPRLRVPAGLQCIAALYLRNNPWISEKSATCRPSHG